MTRNSSNRLQETRLLPHWAGRAGMKAKERHKRQTNELADFIGQWLLRIKPYTNYLVWGLLAMVLAVAALVVWNRWRAAKVQNAWDEFYDGAVLGTPDSSHLEYAFGLRKPNESEGEEAESGPVYEDSAAAPWATLAAAENYRARGCNELFRNKENADRELRRAAEYYTKVLAETEKGSMLHTQATFGLAQTYEALGGDEIQQATALYNEVVETALERYKPGSMAEAIEACDDIVTLALGQADRPKLLVAEATCRDLLKRWASGPYATRAMQRLEDLRRPETKNFYKDFAEFDPTKLKLPPLEEEIPPTKPEGKKPEATKPEAKKPETTKPEGKKPETTKPEGKKPEATKPEAKKPETTEPEAKKPETEQPKPGSKEPKQTEPKPEKSAPEKPEPKQANPEEPAPTKPKAAKPEAPEPKATEPKEPQPKADAPAPEGPETKQAGPEEPEGETKPQPESKPAPGDAAPKPDATP